MSPDARDPRVARPGHPGTRFVHAPEDRRSRAPGIDQFRDPARARRVVHDHDLEAGVLLQTEQAQAVLQLVRAVPGAHHDADERGAGQHGPAAPQERPAGRVGRQASPGQPPGCGQPGRLEPVGDRRPEILPEQRSQLVRERSRPSRAMTHVPTGSECSRPVTRARRYPAEGSGGSGRRAPRPSREWAGTPRAPGPRARGQAPVSRRTWSQNRPLPAGRDRSGAIHRRPEPRVCLAPGIRSPAGGVPGGGTLRKGQVPGRLDRRAEARSLLRAAQRHHETGPREHRPRPANLAS